MTKVIIQIPAFNEEGTLDIAINALPKKLPGVKTVETLIIDDGSSDKTVEVAKKLGVTHIIRHPHNQGLAKAFMTGLKAGLSLGADIIVNTDADNQYEADDIEKLVAPILNKEAEIVIGERPILQTDHFSFTKKLLQKLGSLVVRVASKTEVQDAPSGFRAISRYAAMRLNVFNTYTYTLETIIQAGHMGLPILSVPIRTNEDLRPSRLVKSIRNYVTQSMFTIFRALNTYRPLKSFMAIAAIPFTFGAILVLRWLIFFSNDSPATHIPSLIVGVTAIGIAIQLLIFAFIADLISVNRRLLEEVQLYSREAALKISKTPKVSKK